MKAEFFLELVSEEIPPAQQEVAADNLAHLVGEMFKAQGVEGAKLTEKFSTPLRFGVCFEGVDLEVAASVEERRGPRENAPEKAVQGFKRGAADAEISIRDGYYYAVISKPARQLSEILASCLPELLRNFPWQKSMRWIKGDNFRWVRPLRHICCVLAGQEMGFEVAELKAVAKTQTGEEVSSFAEYKKIMADKNIIINPQERQSKIENQVEGMRFREGDLFSGKQVEPLYDIKHATKQMTQISENPKLILTSIIHSKEDPLNQLLSLLSVKKINKSIFHKELCIPVGSCGDWNGNFLALIDNRKTDATNTIAQGFRKTLNARIKDALFFIDEDKKTGLDNLREKLKGFIFHPRLGTMLDKANRIERLCEKYDDDEIKTAAHYCKADITSLTGKEFPEALGEIVYRVFYLRNEELPPEIGNKIVTAVETHYQPIGAGDRLPSKEGQIIGLADRADTLAGFFSIGEVPTGSKDPFALRRTAIGMIRILLESTDNDFYQFNLKKLFEEALALYPQADKEKTLSLLQNFIAERLKYHFRNNHRPDLVAASMMGAELNLKQIEARLKALDQFIESDDGANLMAAWKRIAGILKNHASPKGFDPKLLKESAEIGLAKKLEQIKGPVAAAIADNDFNQAFTELSTLRTNFDNFFENVRVASEDEALCQNRLALCYKARELMLKAADFSKIEF